MNPTVLLGDEHPATRTGVRLALERGGFIVVAEAGDAPAALAAAAEHGPAVALLDVALPGGGITAAAGMAQASPGTCVVMLSGSSRDEDLFAALQAGAVGYLLKDTDPDRLPLAVAGVLDGEAALPCRLVTRLIHEFQSREHRSRRRLGTDGAELSEREWAVLNGLADGLSTKEIATQLGVSPVTVRRHVSGVLEKLEVPTRGEAVRLLDASRL